MYQTWVITVKKCHTTLPYKYVEIEVTWESSQGPLALSFHFSHISPGESGKQALSIIISILKSRLLVGNDGQNTASSINWNSRIYSL